MPSSLCFRPLVAKSSGKKSPKKPNKRRRFRSADSTQANLKSIRKQQNRYRKQRRQFKRGNDADVQFTAVIIEEIEKSERAWDNEIRKIASPEDLDAFEE